MTVLYKGNSNIREVGQERGRKGLQTTYTVEFVGKYVDLLAAEPWPGVQWSQDPNYYCETAKTIRTKGAMGRTTVVWVYDAGLDVINNVSDLKIEIIWVRNDRDLRCQMQFRDDSQGVGNIDCLALIEDYMAARTAAKRAALLPLIQAFGAKAEKYLELRCKGRDKICMFLPIIRKTSTQQLRPSQLGANLGKRQVPPLGSIGYPVSIEVGDPMNPGQLAIETLAYIKFRDDGTRTGRNKKWERVEEWHGFPAGDVVEGMFRA
jgi:hypothetical protein